MKQASREGARGTRRRARPAEPRAYLRFRANFGAWLEEPFLVALNCAGCEGAVEVARKGDRVTYEAYFAMRAPAASPAVQEGIAGVLLAPLAVDPESSWELDAIPDEDWNAQFRSTLKPFDVGRRLRVVPLPGRTGRHKDRIVVRIPLGRAFGTGEHATTQMCLELLEEMLEPGERVLDVGTGTGILGIAAARLGADEVVALDTDPVAAAVARANVRANRVEDRVLVVCGEIGDLPGKGVFDLGLANLHMEAFRSGMSGRSFRAARAWILGGLLEEQEAEMRTLVGGFGLDLKLAREGDGWCAYVARPAGTRRR